MGSACPLCDSTDLEVVHTYSVNLAAQQWCMADHEPARYANLCEAIEDLWQRGEANVCRCKECQFAFADPFVAGDHRFYSLAFGESGYPRDKWEFDRTIDALRREDCSSWDVLEIGAGGGHFLRRLDELGIGPDQRYGTEYNDVTMSQMRAAGFHIEPYEMSELDKFGRKFGAAFMFQVLEHRDNFDEVFTGLRSVLAEDGHLFIAVPNAKRIDFNENTGSLEDMPPNHISRWTPANFARLADRYGFEFLECEIEPFKAKNYVKQDALLSFVRRSQVPGTLAYHTYPRRKGKVGRAFAIAALGLNAVRRVPVWARNWHEVSGIGENVWVHMRVK